MSDSRPSRRQFLSVGLAAAATAVSGCLDLAGSDDSDRELALSLSGGEDTLRERYVVDLSETRPDHDEAAFEAALNDSDYTTQYRKPFYATPEDPMYTRHEGTYYRLGSVVVDEATETHPVLRLTDAGEVDASDAPDATASDELPRVDQRAVRIAHMAARARGDAGGVPWGLVQRGGYVYRNPEATETSRLLASDGPDHVTFRDRVYAVAVSRERFHEPVYRATIEPVAETPERMESIARAQFVDARLSRDGLSADARDVLRSARGDGYAETHPYSSAYRTVLTALHERAYLDGNVESDAFTDDHGIGMVRYDGRYYDYRLRFRSAEP